jgi:hypothetical protein
LLDNQQTEAKRRFDVLSGLFDPSTFRHLDQVGIAPGWLVVEDADPALQPLICPDEVGPEQGLANQLRDGFRALIAGVRPGHLADGVVLGSQTTG